MGLARWRDRQAAESPATTVGSAMSVTYVGSWSGAASSARAQVVRNRVRTGTAGPAISGIVAPPRFEAAAARSSDPSKVVGMLFDRAA